MRTPHLQGHCYSGVPVEMEKIIGLKGLDISRIEKFPKQTMILRTNVNKDSFIVGPKVILFFIETDYVEMFESRAEEQPVRITAEMMTRFELLDDGRMEVFCFGDAKQSSEVMKALRSLLSLKPRHFTHLELTKEDLKNIFAVDCEIWLRGSWKDIDSETSGGSLRGHLDKSVHSAQFDKKGKVISIKFQSKYLTSRKVSLSYNGTVGIEARDATMAMIVDYFQNVVRPNLTP